MQNSQKEKTIHISLKEIINPTMKVIWVLRNDAECYWKDNLFLKCTKFLHRINRQNKSIPSTPSKTPKQTEKRMLASLYQTGTEVIVNWCIEKNIIEFFRIV